ncbi:MAG TPA: CPBP family intramembrane glutamic endopeptidase [Chitinophagaceae bacterium]|nr:CPBP family intramembrane glutamic endopeptidase [Chitinophagaceae bacterium]
MSSHLSIYGVIMIYYSLFFLAVTTGRKNGSVQLKDVLSGKSEPGELFIRLIAGIFSLGIGTVVIFAKEIIDNKIFVPFLNDYQAPVLILTGAAMAIGSFSAHKELFPADNSRPLLSFSLPLYFLLIRTLYLIVYEFFFRGVMLFVMIKDLGLIAAVALNLLFYALVHWFNRKERIGSVFMGIILCIVSIYYHGVWPAILIHFSLALSHEITLLINNKSLIKKSWL